MKSILNFREFVNESLNEGKLPSWVESGPYQTLKSNFDGDYGPNANGKEMTMADVNKNYKPALKYLGVRSIADMVMVATTNDDENFDPKDKNKIGNNDDVGPATGMWPGPYTAAYKGMLGDVKVIILADHGGEARYAYAAGDSRGNLKESLNENLNEAELPSWVESGPYDSLKDMTGNIDLDGMTVADINKNYQPALKYLGVKSIADMGYLSSTANDDELYDIVAPQMKSSNFLGNDRGKGMNPTPYTGAYKGMLGDVKIIIVQDINQENMYAYAAVDSRGNLK